MLVSSIYFFGNSVGRNKVSPVATPIRRQNVVITRCPIQGHPSADASSAIRMIRIPIIGLSAFTTTTLEIHGGSMEALLNKQKLREGRQDGGFSCDSKWR